MYPYTLIIGGTGMLKEASVALASETTVLSSVARTRRSLKTLDEALSGLSCTHHTLQLDWGDRRHFLDSIASHIQQVGMPALVLAWLHDDSLGLEVARLCSSTTTHCEFFQVRGSSAATLPGGTDGFSRQFLGLPGIIYHQVILGFMRTSSGSRWLRNAEISQGVLGAIASKKPLSIVGTIEPWDERP